MKRLFVSFAFVAAALALAESSLLGYTSPPTVTVPNVPGAKAKATLSFGKDLVTNGAVSAITVVSDKAK